MFILVIYLKLLRNGSADSLKLILNIVGLLATVAVTVYVTKIAKKALDSELNTSDNCRFDR